MSELWTIGNEWCRYQGRYRKNFVWIVLAVFGLSNLLKLEIGLDVILLLVIFLQAIRHNLWTPDTFVTQLAIPRERRIFYSFFTGLLKVAIWSLILMVGMVALLYMLLGLTTGVSVAFLMQMFDIQIAGEYIDYMLLAGLAGFLQTLLAYVLVYPVCVIREEAGATLWVVGAGLVLKGVELLQSWLLVTREIEAVLGTTFGDTVAPMTMTIQEGIGFWTIGMAAALAIAAFVVYRGSAAWYNRASGER